MNAARYEVERRAAFHLDGGPGMVGQDKGWNVIRWIVSPPAFPVGVRPVSANGAEHIPSETPGADIPKAAGGEIVVNPDRAAIVAEHGSLERSCRQQPLVQLGSANAKGVVDVLVRT